MKKAKTPVIKGVKFSSTSANVVLIFPVKMSSPKDPPAILPASYAVFPTTIAAKTKIIINLLISLFDVNSAITEARSFWLINPSLAAISCNETVAMIERSKAHNKLNPNPIPAVLHMVIVPGPINAAATRGPGPIFLNQFFKL